MSKAKVGKKYSHYKGYIYTVIALAREEETLEEVVVYRAEYDTEDFGKKPIWTRKKEMFESTVEVDGVQVERFKLID